MHARSKIYILRLEYWTEDVFHRKMGPYLFESHQRDIFGKFLSLFGYTTNFPI